MTKKKEAEYSVSFFYNLDFQIIKINRIHKIVLIETRFAVPFKFLNSRIQPDWLAKIKFVADGIEGAEYFVSSCIHAFLAYDCVADHSIIFKFFCPQSEHTVHPFCYLVFIGSIALRQEVVNRKRSSLVRLLLKKGNKRKKVNLSKKS